MIKINWENGIDNNFDGHCDLCGRFVDKYGHHRAVRIFDFKSEEINLNHNELDIVNDSYSTERFIKEYIKNDPYNKYQNMTYKYWPYILEYAKNTNNPFSSKCLNAFLRYDIVPKNIDVLKLINRPLEMNCAIGQFVVKNTFVTYRGLSFEKECDFTKMLDEAYKTIKNGKLFVYEEFGFTSTTRDLEYARMLSKRTNSKVHILFAYVNLPNSKAMPLSKENETTNKDWEKEILLKCLHKFYICSIQRYKVSDDIYYRGIIINTEEKNYGN